MTTAERAGAAQERLRWSVDLAGRTWGLDLIPAAVGRSVAVEIDGRLVGRMPKPTQQQPWSEATFGIEGGTVVVGLTWAFPVMRTDVFVTGRSARDGRAIETVRAESPAALSNYEVWFARLSSAPPAHPRRRTRRALLVGELAVSAGVWLVAMVIWPVPAVLRLPLAAALIVSSVVLTVIFVWSWAAFGERVHHALLARPSLGDARAVLWFAAFVGYALLAAVAVGTLLAVAAK